MYLFLLLLLIIYLSGGFWILLVIFTLIRLVCLNPSDSSVQVNQMEYMYMCVALNNCMYIV